jgi:hypothetical protein
MHGKGMHMMQCGCHADGRHFHTKEEKIKMLEEYKDWLENEKKGVEETIDELKKAS